jgi:5'-nucleotidase
MNSRFSLKQIITASVVITSLNVFSPSASALNILLSNDDGLTSNVKALYTALKNAGHDVLVSTPCQGQSGMGGAVQFLRPLTPLSNACLNNAAAAGDPGAGQITKVEDGYDYSDFYYVNGTPVMATAYGLDVLAQARWGKYPDLLLSGPNEGRNTGYIVSSSGTVNNVQFAGGRGVPAIALSGGIESKGVKDEAGNYDDSPDSVVIANLSVKLLDVLITKAAGGSLLPERMLLNVNFPDVVTATTAFKFSRIGSAQELEFVFVSDLSQDPFAQSQGLGSFAFPGVSIRIADGEIDPDQATDEAHVSESAVSVTAMQLSYDHSQYGQQWLQLRLRDLLSK